MSKAAKSKKPFIVRGFNVIDEKTFDCTGVIEKFGSFTEVTVDRQHEAIVAMTTHSDLHTMSTRNLIHTHSSQFPHEPDDTKELYVIDLVVVFNTNNIEDLRSFRSSIRGILKTWSEKSRVTGRRGWRSNAIKTPTFEFDKKLNAVVMRTQVILSTTIFYNDHMTTVNVNFEPLMEHEDLRNLKRAFAREMGPLFEVLKFRHSEIDKKYQW